MKLMQSILIIFCFSVYIYSCTSGTDQNQAYWISHPDFSNSEFGVYLFAKNINISDIQENTIIKVSADNRYRLFVNQQEVGFGPAIGDLENWKYETYDISSFLHKGKNQIVARVINWGNHKARFQQSTQTGFVIISETTPQLNTNSSWKVVKDSSYFPIPPVQGKHVRGGFLAPACDSVVFAFYNHTKKEMNTQSWAAAHQVEPAVFKNQETKAKWKLVPRDIPELEQKKEKFQALRKSPGIIIDSVDFEKKVKLVIEPNQKASILLDMGQLTTAFPVLKFSGGKNSTIKITYAEALFLKGQKDQNGKFIKEGQKKGNRNVVDDKLMIGYYDVIVPDGKQENEFSPMWFRTFRYVQLDFETKEQSLIIEDFYPVFTAYPFKQKAQFKTANATLDKIWDVSWRTARLCAWETYMDCPYYEQLQYIGDTRIQSLISLYITGDDRLMRNALLQYKQSMKGDSLPVSAYPAYGNGTPIPPFALFYTAMVHDYWMFKQDDKFIKSFLPEIDKILAWHEKYLADNYLLGETPYWNFVDWPEEWAWDPELNTGGIPAGAQTGNSSILSIQYIYALQRAAELFDYFQLPQKANYYRELSKKIATACYKLCWDEQKKLLADTPDKNIFSQHANVMAVLTDVIPADNQAKTMMKVVNDTSLIQCTYYYRYYLHQALQKADMGSLFIPLLTPWHEMLERGLTTFAEKPDPTRSDCHAWSAHPMKDFLSITCGIRPDSPGFKTIKIQPAPGKLSEIDAQMPHDLGTIYFKYRKNTQEIFQIQLPQGLNGTFIYKNQKQEIKGGENEIIIDNL